MAFHGTRKDTAVDMLKNDWQLLMPGDMKPSGGSVPIGEGHINRGFKRKNHHTGKQERFNPKQVFTSPSIHYCAYSNSREDYYCDRTQYDGHEYQVAFQLRQEPGTLKIGPQTILDDDDGAGEQIDPLFPNSELEYYTNTRGVHKLYRLLIRKAPARA